jgi:hypothetical protein
MTAAGGTSCGYDANGNQTSRGSDTFSFDHENRLTQAVIGGTTSSSVYYGNGVQKSHTVGGATTTYVWVCGWEPGAVHGLRRAIAMRSIACSMVRTQVRDAGTT